MSKKKDSVAGLGAFTSAWTSCVRILNAHSEHAAFE